MRLFLTIASLVLSTSIIAATPPKNDAEVLNMLMTVNTEELNLSSLGMKKANNPEVKEFAERMMNAHTNGNERAMSLKKAEDLKLAESKPSMKTKSKVESSIEDLKNKEGKAFDRAYMDTQIKTHQDALKNIETNLIPNAKNEQLKALLQTTQDKVEHHLKEAKEIRAKI